MAAAPEAPSFAASLNISASNIGIAIGAFAGDYAIEQGCSFALVLTNFALAMSLIGVALWIGCLAIGKEGQRERRRA
jgi:DHA1 family inner membrane transport protein